MKTALIVLPVDRPMTSATYKDMRARAFWAASVALGLPDSQRYDVEMVDVPHAGWVVDGVFVDLLDGDSATVGRLLSECGGVTHKRFIFAPATVDLEAVA